MLPRILSFVILSVVITLPPPASAKEKKKPAKQAARTWKTLVDYTLKNGGDDSIKAPASRTLGYDSDELSAKSLGIDANKSKDGRDHSIFIVNVKDGKGGLVKKEIVLGSILVKESAPAKEIDSYRIRMTLEGKVIGGMHATGIVGHIAQQSLAPDSAELLAVLKTESTLFLKDIELAQLTQ